MSNTAEQQEEPESSPETIRGIGDNSNLAKGSLEYFVEMIRIRAAREILSADADLARHRAQNKNLNTKALDAELREFQARNDEKEGWRQSREVGQKVLKDKKQGDLFDILEEAKTERKAKRLALKEPIKAEKNDTSS